MVGVAVAVRIALPMAATVACALWFPIWAPSVHDALARPFASVATVAGVIDPPPEVTENATSTAETALPQASVTATMTGTGSGCDAPATWLFPDTIES